MTASIPARRFRSTPVASCAEWRGPRTMTGRGRTPPSPQSS